MQVLSVRQLRAGLAAAIRRAGAGERLVVTVGGRPAAQLGPLTPVDGPATLDDLAHRGLVQRPTRSDRPAADRTIDPLVGARLDRAIVELRGS